MGSARIQLLLCWEISQNSRIMFSGTLFYVTIDWILDSNSEMNDSYLLMRWNIEQKNSSNNVSDNHVSYNDFLQ